MEHTVRNVLLLAAALIALISSTASADIINVFATDDAMVASGSITSNFGDQDGLYTQTQWIYSPVTRRSTYYYQNSYLKFDLSAIPANQGISSISLVLHSMGGVVPAGAVLANYEATDSWTQGTIRWNNQPPVTTSNPYPYTWDGLIGSSSAQAADGTVQFNLTLTPQMMADGVLTIVLENAAMPAAPGQLMYSFNSIEHAGTAYDPYLSINYTPAAPPVPIPAAAWLLGTGLIGLVGVRRRMRK